MDRRKFLGLAAAVSTPGVQMPMFLRKKPPKPTPTPSSASGAQSAVSLTAADGENLSGGVQSNFASNGFYGRNGYTRSTAWVGPKPSGGSYAGFDDVNFLPIVTWLTDFSGTGFYSRMDDLGINGMLPCAGSVSLANNVTFGKWAAVTEESHASGTIASGDDPGVAGVSTGEEPSIQATYESIITAATSWLAGADGPGRWHVFNFADQLMNGDIDNVYFPADFVRGRDATHTNPPPQYTTCDQYWFAGAPSNEGGSQAKLDYRLYGGLNGGSPYTTGQTARGSHYGSMMDSIRKAFSGTSAPIGVWIEAGAPYTETTSAAITPAQMKWAVWATFVHGARGIHYFDHTFRTGDPLATANAFNNDGYGGPGITGTGIYAAAKEVNLRALQIASVINAPLDGYFVYGDLVFPQSESAGVISTPGFLTAVTSTNGRSRFGGVDASCRWQPVEGKHYILATTREVESATNILVTFRMVDQGQTAAVDPFTSASISVSRGGAIPGGFCEFSDTFALASDYKTYRID